MAPSQTENVQHENLGTDSSRNQSINEKIEKAKSEILIEEINSDVPKEPDYERRFNKILFVVTNVSASYGKALNPHLGIAMLMAYLEREGFETAVIDEQLGYSVEQIIQKAKDFKADLIGVTMFSFDFVRTYETINIIQKMTGIPIVLGGAHISSVKKEALEKTNADFCVTRDGEIPLLQLCMGYPLEEIKSLIWKKDDLIIENKIRELNWKLDDLPFPAYEKFELERYIHFIDKRLPLESSRGCPYSCTYCDVKVSMGQAFRPRGPEHILSEIKHWYDKGYRFFEFVDDVFTMEIPRAKKVCQMILDSGMKFDWNCANGIRADRVDEELLTLMKKSGCIFVSYGLETGNPHILKVVKKAITLEKAMETFKLTQKVGLKFAINFIIGHPEETYEKGMDTIRFSKKSLKYADYVMFSNMIPYPGTDVYKWIREQEKTDHARFLRQPEEYLKDTTTKIGLPVFETRVFRYNERVKLLKKGRKVFNKSFLKYRFGKTKGYLIYIIARDNDRFTKLRGIAMGNKIGKQIYNKLKKNYSIHNKLKGVQPGT
jgi:anaerobic magnesium-protoporphyrin IX monomethyl ester cyclase